MKLLVALAFAQLTRLGTILALFLETAQWCGALVPYGVRVSLSCLACPWNGITNPPVTLLGQVAWGSQNQQSKEHEAVNGVLLFVLNTVAPRCTALHRVAPLPSRVPKCEVSAGRTWELQRWRQLRPFHFPVALSFGIMPTSAIAHLRKRKSMRCPFFHSALSWRLLASWR